MTRIIFSAGFWVTVLVFVVFGYAHALGDVCPPGSLKCGVSTENLAIATSVLQDENRKSESDIRASDVARRSRCAPESAARGADPSFPQIANWQRGGSMYAPGLSFWMARRSERVTVCPGPVEIPNSLNQ